MRDSQHSLLLQHPSSILSVDLGVVNSAYALLDNDLTLHKWTKVDLGMPKPYSPTICCDNVSYSTIIQVHIIFIILHVMSSSIVYHTLLSTFPYAYGHLQYSGLHDSCLAQCRDGR